MNTSLSRILRNQFFEGAADVFAHADVELLVQKTNHPGFTPQDQMDFLSEVVARNPAATGDVIGRVWPKEKDANIKAVLELAAKKNPTEIAQLVKSPVLGKAAVLALEKLVSPSSSQGEQRDTDELGTLLAEQLGVESGVLLKGSGSSLLYSAWLSGKLTSSESESAAAVQEVKAHLASGTPQPSFCAPILKQLASLETEQSLNLYDKIFGVRDGLAWEAFLGAGLNESPELALDLLGQGEKQSSQFIRSLAGGLAKSNPENLLSAITLAKIPVEQHPDFEEAAMVSLAIHHPQEALRRSLAGELSDLPKVAYEQIYRSVGRGSFHQVWEAAEKTAMPIEATSAIEFAMQGWADASPESAARWLTEQPVSAHRNAAIMGLVKVIARSDPKSADAWKAQLTP
jgi:hypothetical protein